MTATVRGQAGRAGPLLRLAPVTGPLVGRDAELDRLRHAWVAAVAGDRPLALVTGEAGIGTTRLVAELACEAQAAGAAVLLGRCRDGGADPYQALVDAFRPLVGAPTGVLARLFGGAGADRSPAAGPGREALFEALAGVLAAQCAHGPTLLVIDDLHRAPRSTVLALRHLIGSDDRSGSLVVGIYRDAAVDRTHPLAELLASVHARPEVGRVALDALGPDAVAEMVGDDALGRRLWRHATGNPLLVEELVRLGEPVDGLPAQFDDVVARRVDRLGPASRQVLEVAAVAGDEATDALVASAAGLGDDQVMAALKSCASAGLLVRRPGPPGTVGFAHEPVREAVLRRAGPARRVGLHLRVGEALEQLGPTAGASPAALAWHFRAAAPVGRSAAALRHSSRAGDRAMDQLGWDEAAAHFGDALASASGARSEVRADLLFALGDAQRRAGDPARARQAVLEAAALARNRGDGTRVARAARALGALSAVSGLDPEIEGLAADARSLLGPTAPAPGPVALTPLAAEFASESLYDLLDGVHHQAPDAGPGPDAAAVPRAEAARRAGDPGGAAALLRARHLALAGPEHAPDRLATAQEVVQLAAETGDDELAATGRGWRLLDLLELGRLDEAFADLGVHAALVRHLGASRHGSDAAAWEGMRALLEGRPDDARVASQAMLVLGTRAGDPDAVAANRAQRWGLALEWGSEAELDEVTEACRDRARAPSGAAAWRAALALVLGRRGHLDLAAEELRRALDRGLGELTRHPGRLHPLTCLAEVAWMLDDAERAEALLAMIEPFADRWVVVDRGLLCRGSVARACGLAAATARRWDDAQRYFDAAVLAHRRLGALPLLARTQYEWAAVLAVRGRRGDGRRGTESLRGAVDLATRFDMGRLLRDTAALGLL